MIVSKKRVIFIGIIFYLNQWSHLNNIANKATKKQKVLFQLKRIVKFLAPYLADLLFQLLIEFLKYKLGL